MDHNILSILKTDFEYTQTKNNGENSVYLHIRFNLPLDSSSVNASSIAIKDLDGKYLPCKIHYEALEGSITIDINAYNENTTYCLYLSQRLKSLNKQHLREPVIYSFIIKDGKPCKFVHQQPDSFFNAPLANVSIIDKKYMPNNVINNKMSTKINYASIFFVVCFILSLLLASVLNSYICVLLSMVFLILFFVGLIRNRITNRGKSVLLYNKGVRSFHAQNYQIAISYFEKAFELDRGNLQTKRALNIAFDKYIHNIKWKTIVRYKCVKKMFAITHKM